MRSPKLCRARRRTAISDPRVESCRLRTEEVEASLLKLVKASVEQISATETENVLDALNELRTASAPNSPLETPFEKDPGSSLRPDVRCALLVGRVSAVPC